MLNSVLNGDWSNSVPPLEFVFQEQSYSSLHSGRSLAWDHVRDDIVDPCGAIADFCGVIPDFCRVIADPCSVVAVHEAIGGHAFANAATRSPMRRRRSMHDALSIIKHC